MTDTTRQIDIGPATEPDFKRIWEVFHAVVLPGDSYVFPPDDTREDRAPTSYRSLTNSQLTRSASPRSEDP